MSKVSLEFKARDGEICFSLSGEQEDEGIDENCKWRCEGGDKSSCDFFKFLSGIFETPQEKMLKMENYAKREKLDNYEIKYSVKKDE